MKRRHAILLAIVGAVIGVAATLALVSSRPNCGRRTMPCLKRTEGCCIRVNLISKGTEVRYRQNDRWMSWEAIQSNLARVASISPKQTIQLSANDKTTIQHLQGAKAAIESIGLTNIEITVWQSESTRGLDVWIAPSQQELFELVEEEPTR